MAKPASTSAKAATKSSSSAKVHSSNTSQRSKAKANRKSTNQSSNPTKGPNKASIESLPESSASSSTSNLHGKDSKLAALLKQSATNQSNKPSTSTAQNDKEKEKQVKDVTGKGKEKEKQPEIQKEKDKSAPSSSVAAARKTVFRPVLNSPFTVNWPTVPSNLSEPLLYTLIDLLSHPSLAAIRGKDGSLRDRDKGNGRRKRKLENIRKGEEREEREEREGEEWGEEILRRFKKPRLGEEEKIEKVRDSDEAVAEKEPEREDKESEKQKDVEMEDGTREGEPSSLKEPSTEKDEGTLLKDQAGDVKGGKESEERGPSRFFTIGLNSVTKKLEDQVSKASAYATTNQKTISNSSTSTSIPSITKLALGSDPPLTMVFVCTKDIDPISMIAHFPLLTCAVNAVSEKDCSLEEQEQEPANPASTSISNRFPPVLLIPLPEGSSLELSKALNLRRVSTIGLSLPMNSNSIFDSMKEGNIPSVLLKPLISILQKCSIEPLRANWLDIAAETSILNGNKFKLNDAKLNEEVESSNQVQKRETSQRRLRGPFIKHVRTTAPVDLRSGREKKKLARTQRKIERKEKKRLKLEKEKKELKKLKRKEVGDGEEKKRKKKRVKRKKVEKVGEASASKS